MDEIKASRELDAEITHKIFGVFVPPEKWEWDRMRDGDIDGQIIFEPLVPRFSSDIAAAFEAVEKMRASYWSLHLDNRNGRYRAMFEYVGMAVELRKAFFVVDESAPLAISLAALKSVSEGSSA